MPKKKKSVKKIKKILPPIQAVTVKPVEPKKPRNFILCPTCDSKSKKLFSEMGGLQTRTCKNGHHFEVDTFGGFAHSIRRVERTDRPFFVGGSYTDYVYGRFKNDPDGKKNG